MTPYLTSFDEDFVGWNDSWLNLFDRLVQSKVESFWKHRIFGFKICDLCNPKRRNDRRRGIGFPHDFTQSRIESPFVFIFDTSSRERRGTHSFNPTEGGLTQIKDYESTGLSRQYQVLISHPKAAILLIEISSFKPQLLLLAKHQVMGARTGSDPSNDGSYEPVLDRVIPLTERN